VAEATAVERDETTAVERDEAMVKEMAGAEVEEFTMMTPGGSQVVGTAASTKRRHH